MKCEKIERWISDDLDAALALRKRQELEPHLKACPACREYWSKVRRIQAESKRLEGPEVSLERLEALSAGIMGKLRLESQDKRTGRALSLTWRWARLAVPAVLALALGVVLFQGRGEAPRDDIFSLEGCFDLVAREIAGDAELAAGFNRFITESLAEEGDPSLPSDDIYIWNEPYFWEGLSDDELRLVEEEVKKEIRS
jgi:predicted anti-sigma-YlaC factor YlaD